MLLQDDNYEEDPEDGEHAVEDDGMHLASVDSADEEVLQLDTHPLES